MRVDLGTPPDLGPNAKYGHYKEWLQQHFYRNLCAYCLLQHETLQVDHYEPQAWATDRCHDPTNLLIGCGRCNGRSGKSDYHPNHAQRTRCPRDTSGHLVIDVRVDDFANMFAIAADGVISAKTGPQADRAAWNAALLCLDRCDTARREFLDLLNACESALVAYREAQSPDEAAKFEGFLTTLLPQLAARKLFFDVYGLPISAELRARLDDVPRIAPA